MNAPVLVVEDDPDLAGLVCGLLADDGYEPQLAIDGRDALAKLAVNPLPELILLDLMMPRMSGVEFRLAQLGDPRLADIPVVVMSGAPDAARSTMGLGVKEYLSKPIGADKLLDTVGRYAKRTDVAADDIVQREGWTPSLGSLRDSPISILWCDRAGVVTLAVGNCLAQLGLEAAALKGRDLASLFPLGGPLSTETTTELEARGRWFEIHRKPVFAEGACDGAAVVIIDITERKDALETVRRQHHEAQSILDVLPAMIWLKDWDSRIVRANTAAAASIGRIPGEVEGRLTYDLYPAEDARKYHDDDLEVMRSGQPKLDIIEAYAAGQGELRWIRTDKAPYRGENGEVIGVVVTATDVTPWKKAEEERRQTEEQRKQVLERLRELDELRSRFFANVSHELRTPLALVAGLCDRLGRSELLGSQKRDLDMIATNVRTLTTYVNDLLDLAQLDARKVRPRYAPVDLMRLTRRAASLFEPLAADREIALSVDGDEVIVAEVDGEQMLRVVENLLSNALRHTPDRGSIRCRVRRTDGRATIAVSDSGPGIPSEQRARLFDRFFQAIDDDHTTQGTGLGLAIVKEFVEIHHGGIRIDDVEGGGARLTVEVPLRAPAGVPVAPAAEDLLEERTPDVDATAPARPPKTAPVRVPAVNAGAPVVVLVEDNPEMNRFLSETLGESYVVHSARDGAEGLALARVVDPDAVITDVMMKRMHGDELVSRIRSDHAMDDLPILVLTAWADDAMKERLLREGAQDYVVKPFAVSELMARVGNLVGMRRARRVLQRELSSSTADVERLASDLAERRRELSNALDAMTAARDQAERASALKTSFGRLVTHELRTPLSGLMLGLDLLRRRAPGPDAAAAINRCSASAQRLLGLIESLLEHARIESGSMHIHVAEVDVTELVEETVEEHRPLAEAKGLAIHCMTSGPLPVRSDAKLLRLIAANLVGNAIKFTTRGNVSVVLERSPEGAIRLTVSDTGPGIALANHARIFEPFAQLEAINHKHLPGVGLGLALVREFVGVLGGTIELASVIEGGSVFTVTLPTDPPSVS